MRRRLLDACVASLVELGWSGTTTTEVSRRAGVSRGAQLHHFPSRSELVLAAVAHLAEQREAEMAQASATLPAATGRTRAVLEMLAELFTGPVFTAALELWVAARTDEELRAVVTPFEQELGRAVHRRTVALLGADESRPGVRELVQATLDLVRGLGLAETLGDDSVRRGRVLDQWALVLEARLPGPDDHHPAGPAGPPLEDP